MRILGLVAALALLGGPIPPTRAAAAQAPAQPWLDSSMGLLQGELTARYGLGQRPRIQRGLAQVARFWRPGDGGAAEFEAFVREQFAGDGPALDGLFGRMACVTASLEGHRLETTRDLRRYADLDLGPPLPIDGILAGFDPGAHLGEDGFADKLAFAVLLNFPLTTLEERLRDGGAWSGRQWAEARLAERYGRRVPAAVDQAVTAAASAAERYLAGYDLRMDHLVHDGRRLFPPGQRLLCHWNLREEIRAQYAGGAQGPARQREIQQVLERIVTQTIPAGVIDNPRVDWDPFSNQVRPAAAGDPAPDPAPDDRRYRMLLGTFQAARQLDACSPALPTQIRRSFEEDRQLPEARVRQMLEAVCDSPLAARTARLIRARLGRALEPFDLWYPGFRPGFGRPEAELDALVRQRYPDAAAYRKDLPRLLRQLGFAPDKADWLAARIQVEPARGPGAALGPGIPGDRAHLYARIGPGGMDAKGFDSAVHETGHCVEQAFARNGTEYPLMAGAPGAAFTEALAFVFQAHGLALLGLPRPGPRDQALAVLDTFWSTWEISGVALVDMAVWQWLYQHPGATAQDLQQAVLAIARDRWNRSYAPVLGHRDCALLACYSHLVDRPLDLPDYPLGRMIAFQLQRQFDRTGNLGAEFERMATLGRLTPDLWLQRATGGTLGPEALLEATEAALNR